MPLSPVAWYVASRLPSREASRLDEIYPLFHELPNYSVSVRIVLLLLSLSYSLFNCKIAETRKRDFWIEEYPTPNPNDDTMNGFGSALFGLIDYAKITGDALAKRFSGAGLTTSLYGASLVRHPGGMSSYSVSHPGERPHTYHHVVTNQLTIFAALTGDTQFATMAKAFKQDFA